MKANSPKQRCPSVWLVILTSLLLLQKGCKTLSNGTFNISFLRFFYLNNVH